jgi:MoaA/NifB/PqqE/SkfB family radical SAM enzyme
LARLVIELTNRCNLRCGHCYAERHAASGDLPLEILEKVIAEAWDCGIDHLCFTGGEPTVHRRFDQIVRRVVDAGYRFSFVSNGSRIPSIYPLLLQSRHAFQGATFSLDGAKEKTHDSLRGAGSYRQVMRAASIFVARNLPFTFNMVVTGRNLAELAEMVSLAERLGSGGVRFGHLMPTSDTALRGLDLDLQSRFRIESEIWKLQKKSSVRVDMAPGYFSESPFFPCAPLELEEFNLDYRGNVTLCCQLSGYAGVNSGSDVAGSLHEISLTEACRRFRGRVATYIAAKRARIAQAPLSELEHFPCLYCISYLGKASALPVFASPSRSV